MISKTIKNILENELLKRWDGRECILELKKYSERDNKNYNWKQMEWIGWYFEWKARKILNDQLGGAIGPKYGSVTFDYQYNGIWDFKAHPNNQSADWAYTNDVDAVNKCIESNSHLGFIIADGKAEYDDTGSFKSWHDILKGKKSNYEIERINRGAPSRKRKKSFLVEKIVIIEFNNLNDLELGIKNGWLRNDMQKGLRNSNGSERAAKYGINMEEYLKNYLTLAL